MEGICKDEMRRAYKKIRAGLPASERFAKSERLCQHIIASPFFTADSLFTFIGFGDETDTRPLIAAALQHGKRVAVPVAKSGGRMDFVAITDLEHLQPSRFGMLEPTCGEIILPDNRTLMIVPGLAFDRCGYRVGYGKGFYDRYLSRTQPMETIGVCFHAQVAEAVPYDAYDIVVNWICTEKGLVKRL